MKRCRHSQASSCDQHRPISSTLACPAYAEPSIVSQERVTPTSCTCICATSHRSRGRRDSRLVPCILLDPPRCIALRLTSRHKPQRNRVVCDAGDSRASVCPCAYYSTHPGASHLASHPDKPQRHRSLCDASDSRVSRARENRRCLASPLPTPLTLPARRALWTPSRARCT